MALSPEVLIELKLWLSDDSR